MMNNENSMGKKKVQHKNSLPQSPNEQNAVLNQTVTNSMMAESKIIPLDKQRISFYPKQLTFSVRNSEERQFLQVQNITSTPLRLKIVKPKTRHFRIIYDNGIEESYMLVPGLRQKIQVEYKRADKGSMQQSKSRLNQTQVYDCLKLQLQTKTYEVVLQAVKEAPSLTYEKLIDVKFVDMNKLLKLHKRITNDSDDIVKLKLLKQSWDNMHIVPQELTLKPRSEDTLQFSITPTIVGTYHHKILVQANGVALDPIQIVYTTYDYNYCITDQNGNKVSQVNFGYMYFGNKKIMTMWAVNNTPNTVEMKGKIRIGRNNPLESTFQSPQEFGQECSATLVEIHPKNLRIQPFSKQRLTLSSLGKITEEHIGKVIKCSKSALNQPIIKTSKRVTQAMEKYKIEDEEFHECFISQFTVINPKDLNKDSNNINARNKSVKKQKQSPHPNVVPRTSILSNVVLTELKVYYGLPMVKITPSQFDFGKVMISKPANLSFTLTNLNPELPAQVSFSKIIRVEIFPKDAVIMPNETKEFQMFVTPINMGSINEKLKITIEENYVVQCRLRYEVVSNRSLFKLNSSKEKVLHKSLHHDNSFSKSYNEGDDKPTINFNSTLEMLQKTCHNQVYKPKNKPTHSSSLFNIRKGPATSASKNRFNNNLINRGFSMNVAEGYRGSTAGGNNANTSMRPGEQNSSTDVYEQANSIRGGKKKRADSREIEMFEEECLNTSTVKQQQISLPSPKENLFVTKKIDKYEPYSLGHNSRKLLKSKTAKDFFSAVIKRQPRNRRQAEEISMQLKGESLKLIKINTKNISFGKMFVGSRMQKEFVVENDTEYSIEVRLKSVNVESQIQKLESEMLTGTDYGQQIVSSHGVANFKICLFAKQCGKFEKAITYIINKVHEFQFLVEAEIELAALAINKNILKMSYLDDLSEMYLKDTFVLRNDGNATTEFSISQQNDHFSIQPSKGIVQPGDSLNVCLTYKGAVQTVINAGESIGLSSGSKQGKLQGNPLISQNFVDQRISVDIKNGINMSIRVTFNPNLADPRCIVKESKINFGVSIVSKPKTKSFLLRNLSRTMTLFQIQNNECSQFLFFDLTKGKLPPESSKQISVTYKSSIIQQIDSSFKINVRGGLTINVPIIAESVAPNIRLAEDSYNFGDVCCGSSQVKAVNIINESETVVELLLDLLDKGTHGTEYLYVSFVSQDNHALFDEQTGNEKPSSGAGILKKHSTENGPFFNNNPSQLQSSGFQTEDETIIDNACLQPQIHKLKIQPKSVYKFYIIFKPKLPGYYEFQLPLYLQNFIKNDSLNKVVTCFATEPKFIVEPSIIRFKKKIINEKESTAFHPLIEFITLKNPGDKELKWKIDYQAQNNPSSSGIGSSHHPTTGSIKSFNSIMPTPSTNNITTPNNTTIIPISSVVKNYTHQPDNRFCFQIENKKGVVKPQSWECINIAFNPFEAGLYCYKLPLLIFNEERGVYQQQAEIRLQGEGQYPTLFFDRKEVVMPVVPLGVESVAMFKLINQGYQSISLKHRIEIYDLEGNCVVQGSNYYQNTHTSHHSIPQINIIYPEGVKMGINKKELYVIVKFMYKKPISFTCKLQLYDNTKDCRVYSIPVSGTTDSSILTLFTYLSDPQNRYKLVPSAHQPTSYQQKSLKNLPNTYVINVESVDDRNPVDKYHNPYEKMTPQQFVLDCEIIRRWINGFLKDEKVGKFPEDVIANPENFLKLLAKMTAKKEFQTLIAVLNSQTQQTPPGQQPTQPKEPQHPPFNQQKNNSYFNSTLNNSNNIFAQFLSVPVHFNSRLQFYQYLIKLLKSMGCLLNHIRPYFLLQKEEFFAHMEKDPNWKNMAETYTKNYEVMHIEAWIVLFYQVINSFWYNTQKLKAALTQGDKNHPNSTALSASLNSNIYSSNEMTVLRWIKTIYEKYNEFEDTFYKFLSYGQDFKDSVGLIYAIYHHIINPQKKKKSLEGLTKKPSTPNEITSNVRILYQLIEKIGLVPLIYEEEFSMIKQKEMFLFIYQLYELLPQQLPKSEPIYFTCNLGEKCTKFIEIKNPSNKVVHYWIKLEGSRDFHHQEKESIRLEPKSVFKFKVNFDSRISQEEVAYLTFLNKLEGGDNTNASNNGQSGNNANSSSSTAVAGSTLVFQLRSKIIGRKSIKKLEPIYCSIYESQMIRIPIQNQFEDCEFANFQIHLFEEILQNANQSDTKPKLFSLRKFKPQEATLTSEDQPVLQTDKKSAKMQEDKQKITLQKLNENQKQQGKQNISNQQSDLVNFFVDNETIKIKKNSSSYIELMFNPILYYKIKCYLIFHDPLVGEFQYEIIGISEMPKILQELKYPSTLYTSMKETLQVNIPLYNNFMIKANMLMEQKLYSKNGRQKPLKKGDDSLDNYKVEINMDQKILQYVTFPNDFMLKTSKKLTPTQQLSKLRIDCFFPVVIKDLALDFLLINQDKTDVRRIKLHLNLASKPITNELIIRTTARVPIVQPIPIQNTSAKDWRVKATLTEDEENEKSPGYLSLKEGERLMSRDFIVKKINTAGNNNNTMIQAPTSSNMLIVNNNSINTPGTTTTSQTLTLVFAPKWLCRLTGKLHIQNITTNQQLIYHIKASCEQPISQGHIYFKIKTSTQEQKKITIKNPYNESLGYRIETDIDQMIKLPQFVYMEPNQEVSVNITMEALVQSRNIGYLKFTDQKGRFFWYTLTIESYDDSMPDKLLEMATEVNQSVEKLIDIYNPTNQKIKFQIILPENCFLFGEQFVDVQPHDSASTKITFKPTQVFQKKAQIKIVNKIAGNVVYKLSLCSRDTPKKTTQTLSAQVNKSAFTSFKISNSLKAPIKIKCELSTTKYFDLQYNQIVPSKSDGDVRVEFKPLEEGKYPCVLKIFGEQFQTKCYEIEGIGLKPFSVEKIEMKTGCETPVLEIIRFKNPNPKKIKERVEIVLEDKEFVHNCFKLITNKGEQKQWDTFVSDLLAVPIQFNPTEKGYFQSMLYIKCAHYEWKYMLKGTTNSKTSTEVQQNIQGECKKQIVKIMKVPIPNYLKKQQNFSIGMLDKVDIECEDARIASKLRSWMHIKIQTPIQVEDKSLANSNIADEQELTLMLKLTPLQPIEQIITLNIYNIKSQGSIRLSHKIKLHIKPSEPEQTISIDVSSIKKYKFEVNLEEIGVIAKKGQPVSCQMMKKELVECRFVNSNKKEEEKIVEKQEKLQAGTRNSSPNSSQKSLFNLMRMSQSTNGNSIIEVTFTPNNLIFNSTKGKNQYSDVLMVFTEKNFWSCEIVFKQSTNQQKAK